MFDHFSQMAISPIINCLKIEHNRKNEISINSLYDKDGAAVV